jgi:NAD(P)-dependent dehydrogenase (short-subunit alcohol dehydrogenase family)
MRKLNENLARSTPVGRAGQPEDCAQAALFLASDEGGYINGHDLVVDGGMVARGTW